MTPSLPTLEPTDAPAAGPTTPAARRVGFVAGTLEGTGGLELFELTAARGLADRGWDVVCAYVEPGNLLERWTDTAEVHPAAETAGGSPTVLRDVDVLYVHDTLRMPAALDIGRRAGRPVVGHLHLPPFHLRQRLARLRGRHTYAIDEDVIGRRTGVDRFIAVSHHTRRTWIAAGLPADRVEVVHNGVDLARYRPAAPGEREALRASLGIDEDEFVVGYVGRLERMKGVAHLMRAFAAVDSSTKRRMRLLVVGGPSRRIEGELGAKKEAFVAELYRTAPAHTTWLGRRDDVDELYRAMDLLVVPSQWEEPFGLVATEALASGIPVIGTKRGGLAEILVGPLSEDLVGASWRSIARGIRRYVEQPLLGARVGVAGRHLVESKFDITRTVREIERVLEGVS